MQDSIFIKTKKKLSKKSISFALAITTITTLGLGTIVTKTLADNDSPKIEKIKSNSDNVEIKKITNTKELENKRKRIAEFIKKLDSLNLTDKQVYIDKANNNYNLKELLQQAENESNDNNHANNTRQIDELLQIAQNSLSRSDLANVRDVINSSQYLTDEDKINFNNKATEIEQQIVAKEKSEEEARQKAEAEARQKAEEEAKQKTNTVVQSGPLKFDGNGLLIETASAKAQQAINLLLGIPGHSNGSSYHASTGLDDLIDTLTTEEAVYVIHRIEGAGFGQTGAGYAGYDTAQSHQAFVNQQVNGRFGGSVHALLKKWGTYSYGGY